MAEETQKKEVTQQNGGTLEKQESGKGRVLGWLILFSVIAAGTTGGFALSQLIGSTRPAPSAAEGQDPTQKDAMEAFLSKNGQAHATWTFDQIEPVVANLDEPGVTRYIRATVTLEIIGEADKTKVEPFLVEKNPMMKDWLTTYFAGLSLEDVRGSRNLSRIKQEIQDHLNEMLFANSKPFIKRVLFKEFAVQ